MEIAIADGMLESYADAPGVRDELKTAVTLVLTAARDRDMAKNQVIRRGLDGSAAIKTYEDQELRRAEHVKKFGSEAGFRP
jgi:hypothetical protein